MTKDTAAPLDRWTLTFPSLHERCHVKLEGQLDQVVDLLQSTVHAERREQ